MAEDTFIEPRASEEPYTRIKTLGRGAFGEAVLYRKTEDNVLVVVKEVNLSRASEKERADAEKEVDILSLLNHTNIVTYYNHYIDGTSLLIEMEYCNGGTLNDKIHAQKELFAEEIVIWYFFQICSGMSHIHDCDIVHRDIKTLNIFLTKSGLVKLGDFGIATILKGSEDMAESVVGTPYYMSPEIIQGQKYNQKSDMWALGCVLYEMLTLKKVFDATNPLRLVSDIVKGQFTDISPRYTAEMNSLVNVLLSQNPDDRPSIDAVLAMPLLSNLGREMEKKVWELNASTRRTRLVTSSSIDAVPVITSKTSDVFYWGGGKQTPQKVDMFQGGHSALQLAVGQSHFAVVTVENELFTWAIAHGGKRMVGQLGHGDTATYRIPKPIEELHGIPIKQVACGDEITACITEDGVLYTFGSDYWGCIGCNNELDEDVTLPFRVDFFAGNPVAEVACGECHIVVITVSKEVYSWGCGEYGRLGQGSEDDCAAPQKVNIPTQCKVLAVCCGTDFTFLLTTAGRLLGFGNNEENQLGMNTPQSLRKRQIKSTTGHLPYVTSPKPVMSFNKYSISSVAAGRSHSAVIDVYGRLITVGSNKFGQLGLGDFKPRAGPSVVGGDMVGKRIVQAACGDDFTVVATADNQIYSWGRGDNGRLGVLTDSLMRAKGGIPCTAVPRPIFGALHILSCIACTHWNSIIIAERVLSSRTVKRGGAQGRSLESQSSGDNAPDSEFLDPIRLDTNQDSDNLFGDLTKDSGVGRSPRAPGFGSDPRSQEESSMPPAWLQDELDQAEYISMGSVGSESSERSLSGSGQTLSSSESSVPGWLKNELRDAEYIPIGGLTPPAGRDSKYETSTSSVAVQCDLEPRDVEDMKTLLLQVQQENAKLRETLAQQNKEMKILQQENNNFVVNQRKFWELIDSWHKDCQQAMPLGLADPREDGNVGRLGSAGARSSTDSFDDAWEV
ncbi:serine/threonine-protein kinase Nek9-like isoform X1 [Acropora palmata]|uniref:serine/threonine-protein kinase Nek9-like isoform X1 n=1 Tax=Acropora palmata TaxID=6131 RepID=UPI003DA18C5E